MELIWYLLTRNERLGSQSLKEELIKIEEAVKLNDHDGIESLLNDAVAISTTSEQLLKEMLDQFWKIACSMIGLSDIKGYLKSIKVSRKRGYANG